MSFVAYFHPCSSISVQREINHVKTADTSILSEFPCYVKDSARATPCNTIIFLIKTPQLMLLSYHWRLRMILRSARAARGRRLG